MVKKLIVMLLLASITADSAGTSAVVSTFKIRPQGVNGARKVAGEIPGTHTHIYQDCQANESYDSLLLGKQPAHYTTKENVNYTFFSITPEYQRSFRPGAITQALFGNDPQGCNQYRTVSIQGSNVDNRTSTAWLADNFYLPADYEGTLSFAPSISQCTVDLNAYISLDRWRQNAYCRLYAPFVHAQWDLNMIENILLQGTDSPGTLPTATSFFTGNTPTAQTILYGPTSYAINNNGNPNVQPSNPTYEVPVINNPLSVGKMSTCSAERNGLGEIRGELGYDFWHCPESHLGAYLAAALPTGRKINTDYLFSPVIGNGKHTELGVGLTGHWTAWQHACEDKQLIFCIDATLSHLCTTKQCRTFDLTCVNGSLSRYMLAAKMTENTNGLAGSESKNSSFIFRPEPPLEPAHYQFDNAFTPIANLTAQKVKVRINAQLDATAWFNYSANGLSVDCGYNVWLQTAEKIKPTGCGSRLRAEANTWVIKGDASVVGVAYQATNLPDLGNRFPPNTINYAIPFSESKATINAGTSIGFIEPDTTADISHQNYGVDNPLFGSVPLIIGPTNPTDQIDTLLYAPNTTSTRLSPQGDPALKISVDPIFLTEQNIQYNQNNSVLSHTFFGTIGYTWERECSAPYLSLGGQVECGASGNKHCSSKSINSAVSQWGLWTKIGVLFN
ncbi:MAG: hypothetical protein NT124_00555 [Candidatus Dependentiae bacterium]|nr:hypothetical protein [Candidatus Dependentiae bacterium]